MGDAERAVAALRAGGLVVLPTETVYGLAADATDPGAVARIYAAKGRPADHPLILHLSADARLADWADAVPDYARRLADRFWPGPMTLVLRRSKRVGDYITGGQDTVAIRVPDHPVAQVVLARFGSAVAAPSANRFGHVSPTTAQHAAADLGSRLVAGRDIVLDGGPCRVGVESTIIDCTRERPAILRPGSVGAAEVAAVAGPLSGAVPKVRVSGSLQSHYAPRARVRLVGEADLRDESAPSRDAPQPTVGVLASAAVPTPDGAVRLAAPADAVEYARVLYVSLREADALQLHEVLAVPPADDSGAAVAVLDRLTRAAAQRGDY